MSLLDDFRTINGVDHYPRFIRRRAGMSIPFNRPLYHTRVECRCGWKDAGNHKKKEAESNYRHHIREEKGRADT